MRSYYLPCLALLAIGAGPPPKTTTPTEVVANSPASAWRAIDPDDLMVMDLKNGGRVVIQLAPQFAPVHVANMRGDRPRVIVEEFVRFDSEITLLTVATKDGILFCPPIGHRQEAGDYRESWQPAAIADGALLSARHQARKVVEALGGHGVFGVEFFVSGGQAIFSELSPRPHDTGMVTLISQQLNEFELHLRAILGLPIPAIELIGPSASAVILASQESETISYEGIAEAMAVGAPGRPVDLRLFAKPTSLKNRRMGVALARDRDADDAVARAVAAASRVKIRYGK